MDASGLQHTFRDVLFYSGIQKPVSVHTLRQRLKQKYPENLGASVAAPEPVDTTHEPKWCFPSCGQPQLFQRAIRPNGVFSYLDMIRHEPF